jgi:hypothetical protein
MKYSKTKTKTKKVIIITLLSLACIAGLISAFAYFKLKKSDPKQVQQQAEQQESTEAKKTAETEASNTQSGSQEQVDKSSDTNTNGGGTNTTPANAAVNIDSAIQESNIVNVISSVTGVSSGSCQFKFSAPDGSSLSKTSDIADGKCKLATSALEFSFIGEWSVVVSVGDVSSSAKGVNIQ